MATIYLIRHGQASFGKADYDQLSEVGFEQSKILGRHWQHHKSPDQIYCGDLLRHGQTLEHFLLGNQQTQAPTIMHRGFNEFDHVDILGQYDDSWLDFAKNSESLACEKTSNREIQHQFSLAIDQWVANDGTYKVTWPQFKARCVGALHEVISQSRRAKELHSLPTQDIAIFTSGGPIAVIIGHVLGLNDQQILRINQQIRNTSVSKLLFSENDLGVDYINNYSHLTLAGPRWTTFR